MGLLSDSMLLAAVRSCIRRDRSYVLRTYAIVGLLVSLFALALLLLALPTWIAQAGQTSATLMLAQGLLFLGGIGVIAAVMAPLLLAHRRLPTAGENGRLEMVYGGLGYVLILAVYTSFIISAPSDELGESPSLLEPIVSSLNALDPLLAVVPPLAVLLLLLYVDRSFDA